MAAEVSGSQRCRRSVGFRRIGSPPVSSPHTRSPNQRYAVVFSIGVVFGFGGRL
jgi:hypothetical protein